MGFRLFGDSNPPSAEDRPVSTDSDNDEIVVYGTSWCGDCRRSRHFLEQHNVSYRWVDIDREPAGAAVVLTVNRGRRSVPTIIFADGTSLTEPSNGELGRKLGIPL